MAALADFMPHILPYASGCSYPMAEQHLRAILLDFCMHAPIVQEKLEPIDVVAGQCEYELDMPLGCDMVHILQAQLRSQSLGILAQSTHLTPFPGTPRAVQQGPTNTILLDCLPLESAAQALHLLVSMKPARNANRVADVLLNDYGYEIGQGVVGRLLLIPGQAFSAPGLSPLYTQTYLTARTDARIRAERGFGVTSMRALPRRFI
jgi:hypothetical protein